MVVPTVASNQCEVVLVGCGAPLRGMGWYHAEQLLLGRCPSAVLCYIVEPWFLGPGSTGPGGPEFKVYQQQTEEKYGVQFVMSLADLPPVEDGKKRLALISGRTADNPKLLVQAIEAGCTTIYLEKPGAPTVQELEQMRTTANEKNVTVLMGYNKNVCKFVQLARTYQKDHGGEITFISNNTYENTPESLGECFERNAEGMLKNMAIHELALLVSFYDVTVENIAEIIPDKSFSSLQTLKGPSSQKDFTDFDKIKFTIQTKTGKQATIQADRCGGSTSYAVVTDSTGNEVFRHSMPDEEDQANVERLSLQYPGAMPYFFSQDPDYETLKERVANQCANGIVAEGVATIDIAVETLRVAEYLTPTIQKELLG